MLSILPRTDTFIFPQITTIESDYSIILSENTFTFNSLLKNLLKKWRYFLL